MFASRSVYVCKPLQLGMSIKLSYATSKTKGNRSEAIVELIELGLAVASSQQPTQSGMTLQDNVSYREVNETVTALASQVDQLTDTLLSALLPEHRQLGML